MRPGLSRILAGPHLVAARGGLWLLRGSSHGAAREQAGVPEEREDEEGTGWRASGLQKGSQAKQD